MELLKYTFIFCVFSVIGWIIELIYRSILTKRIVNPGFMTGCVVPLYGFGAIILNILCTFFLSINSNYKIIIIALLSMILLSLLEFISGWLILKFFNLRLWDYTNNKFNYKGFICLRFSAIWGICSIIYYYLFFPWINIYAYNFVSNGFCLFSLGMFYGVFFIDLFVTIDLLKKIKEYSKSIKQIISLQKIKLDSVTQSTRKKFWDAIYPYISTNRFLKDKIKKK